MLLYATIRNTKQLRVQKTIALEKTPFRVTPYWKNADIKKSILYVEDPEQLRKMSSKKEELIMNIFVARAMEGNFKTSFAVVC